MSIDDAASANKMVYIKDFARFILDNKLNDVVPVYLMNLYSFKIPFVQYFINLSEEEKLEKAKDGIIKLLTGLQKDNALEDVQERFDTWRNNGIPGIPRNAISLKDLTQLYSAQKISFQSFLPYYTTDIAIATEIINEIELYYKQVQDIAFLTTESIRQEDNQKRIESEEKYRDLFDNASDLIQILTTEGKIIYVNNAWSNTFNYDKDEVKGRLIYDLVKDSEVDKFKEYRKKVIDGEPMSFELRTCFKSRNGTEVIIEVSVTCRYINGKAEYTREILRNITNKIEQEKKIKFYIDQLAEREENFRDIIENGPDGVIVIDNPGNVLLWNSKAEDIFGWKKEEVAGKKMIDIISPVELRSAHDNGMARYAATKKPRILNKTVEVPAIRKNGERFFISLTVSHSKQGGSDIYIAFLRDITEQKKNELELENKRKQLEKSNRELEQYAWLTSHDLKEPLRKILTFSDALIKKTSENQSEETFRFLNKIHGSATRMNGLIEAVLIYSNVASDEALFVPTDLNIILKEVIEDLELIIASKGAVIHADVLPVIEAIPVQMRQLFQNLLSNAVKYSNANVKPEIKITCNSKDAGYEIIVKDNGIGFDKMYAEKIFQIFQRLLTSKIYEGTGIGLALCKKIAETHKGTINADSKPGEGSSFIVYLPEKH